MRKTPPKEPVRRTVFLDHDVLVFARNSLLDDKDKVERAGSMTSEWEEKYLQAQTLLGKLICRDGATVINRKERIDAAFTIAWAKKKADGYRYGQDALEGVRFGFEIAYADLLDQFDRAEVECRAYERRITELCGAYIDQLSACRAALGEACETLRLIASKDIAPSEINLDGVERLAAIGQPK